MPDWLRDLHDKAGDASRERPWRPWLYNAAPVDAEFIAAASPERVRALCELAEAARMRWNVEDGWDEHSNIIVPYKDWRRLQTALAALASLEPARKEET